MGRRLRRTAPSPMFSTTSRIWNWMTRSSTAGRGSATRCASETRSSLSRGSTRPRSSKMGAISNYFETSSLCSSLGRQSSSGSACHSISATSFPSSTSTSGSTSTPCRSRPSSRDARTTPEMQGATQTPLPMQPMGRLEGRLLYPQRHRITLGSYLLRDWAALAQPTKVT